MKKTFVISDESENSYGLTVRTAGIDTRRFLKNPVMFYMHDRSLGVIGLWENLRIKNTQLLADAVFDESDELALKVMGKVEKGFIKSASIGICLDDKHVKDGIVSQCVLRECSIVDIPSNENALVLYDKYEKRIENPKDYLLNLNLSAEHTDLREKLASILGLKETTEGSIIKEVERIRQISFQYSTIINPADRIKRAIHLGLIQEDSQSLYLSMAQSDPNGLLKHLQEIEEKKLADISSEIDVFLVEKHDKLLYQPYSSYEKMRAFGRQSIENFNLLKEFIENMPNQYTIGETPEDVIEYSKTNYKPCSLLDDYRKNRPEELRSNPKLYQSLLEREFNNNQTKKSRWQR